MLISLRKFPRGYFVDGWPGEGDVYASGIVLEVASIPSHGTRILVEEGDGGQYLWRPNEVQRIRRVKGIGTIV